MPVTQHPLVSVIIPCYNAEGSVARAIRSVVDQSYDSVEVIVIDDGSKDRSVDVLKAHDGRITWETGPNRGACHARNRGTQIARGDHVLYLDADDYLAGPMLASLVDRAMAGLDLVVASHMVENDRGELVAKRAWPRISTQHDLMYHNIAEPLQTAAFLWRREYVLRNGGWDETLPIFQDTEFAIRMLLAQPRFDVIGDESGHVVWSAMGGNNRITMKIGQYKIKAMLDVLERHHDALRSYDDLRINKVLARRFLFVSRIAYICRERCIGNRAMNIAYDLGVKQIPETGVHNILSRLLGFRRKIELLADLYCIRFRSDPARRPYPYSLRSYVVEDPVDDQVLRDECILEGRERDTSRRARINRKKV